MCDFDFKQHLITLPQIKQKSVGSYSYVFSVGQRILRAVTVAGAQ